jgi:hypothetical protein
MGALGEHPLNLGRPTSLAPLNIVAGRHPPMISRIFVTPLTSPSLSSEYEREGTQTMTEDDNIGDAGMGRGIRRSDATWLDLRKAIAEEIIGKLPATLPVEQIALRLSIPPADIRRGLANGTIVTTIADGTLHMVCDASHVFLQQQSKIRLPLPESLRPVGAASTLRVRESIL